MESCQVLNAREQRDPDHNHLKEGLGAAQVQGAPYRPPQQDPQPDHLQGLEGVSKSTQFLQELGIVAEHPFQHQHPNGGQTGCCADQKPPSGQGGVSPRQHQRRHHPTEHQHRRHVGGRLHGVERVAPVSKNGKTAHEFHLKRGIVHDAVACGRHAACCFDAGGFDDALSGPVFPRIAAVP